MHVRPLGCIAATSHPSLKGFDNPRITYAAILALLRELNGSRLLTLAYAIDALSKPLRPQILPVIYPA